MSGLLAARALSGHFSRVTLVDRDALPAFDAGTGRVSGLVVRSKRGSAQETLGADLVADASGRGSQSPRWLEEAGCGHPDEISVKVNVGYATRTFARKHQLVTSAQPLTDIVSYRFPAN